MGYIQNQIIDLGKAKGKVTSMEIQKYYPPQEVERQMNKLIMLGYFKNPVDKISHIEWEYNK